MKQFILFALLVVILATGCDDDDMLNPIAQIGRADGWKISSIDSDMEAKVDAALAAVTDAQIDADPRSREALEMEYEERVSTTTVVDDCDRDDLFFFVSNGTMRLILDGVTCAADGDPNPLSGYSDRSFSLNNDASEITIRSAGGAFLDRFSILEVSQNTFVFEGERTIADSIFTDLTYQIRYDLIAN